MEKDMKYKQGNSARDQQDFGDDDEKVEKFFSIIRRLRDAKNFSTNSLREMEARKRMKKAKKVQESVWTPFQAEDFMELTDVTRPGSSNKQQEKEKTPELDLNLSL